MTTLQKMWLIEKIVNDVVFQHIVMTSNDSVEIKFFDKGGNFHHQGMTPNGHLVILG